jgi:ribosome maturation factor RimP
MIDKAVVQEIIEEYLKNSDNYLTDLKIEPGERIVVEIDSDRSVSIDDCVALTKHIESQLDRNVEDYELEVGSAGLSQAFKVLRQYKKNTGKEVETLLKAGNKYSGILKEVDEDQIVLTIEKQVKPEGAKRKITVQEDLTFAYSEIKYTKNIIRFK